jgi:neopullulanase
MFAYPGAPCLFYGDEIGLTGGHDPDCRKSFPWDASRWNHDLLNYTKAIIALRKEHVTLRRGAYQRLYAEEHIFAFARKMEERSLVIVLNAGDVSKRVDFSVQMLGAYNSDPATIFGPDTHPYIENNTIHIEIAPRSGIIIRLN